jgi:protein AroM
MNDTVVGIYTIGQTPRPDITENLGSLSDSFRFEVWGALDDLNQDQVPACGPDGYPLETRLRDGTRVVVDAAFLEPRLQEAVTKWDDRVSAHLVLCAGSFPRLSAQKTLIKPFDVAVTHFAASFIERIEVLVPFGAQATSSVRKWEAAGFSCRAHVLGKSSTSGFAEWRLPETVGETNADAMVIDYVGFPATALKQAQTEIDIPVFDLGYFAIDSLERCLEKL